MTHYGRSYILKDGNKCVGPGSGDNIKVGGCNEFGSLNNTLWDVTTGGIRHVSSGRLIMGGCSRDNSVKLNHGTGGHTLKWYGDWGGVIARDQQCAWERTMCYGNGDPNWQEIHKVNDVNERWRCAPYSVVKEADVERACCESDTSKPWHGALCTPEIQPGSAKCENYMASKCAAVSGNSSPAIMTDSKCKEWCKRSINSGDGKCDNIKMMHCQLNPSSSYCKCINADKDPNIMNLITSVKAGIPELGNVPLRCFEQTQCRTTLDLEDQLIPTQIRNEQCPDVNSIRQTITNNGTIIGSTFTATIKTDGDSSGSGGSGGSEEENTIPFDHKDKGLFELMRENLMIIVLILVTIISLLTGLIFIMKDPNIKPVKD